MKKAIILSFVAIITVVLCMTSFLISRERERVLASIPPYKETLDENLLFDLSQKYRIDNGLPIYEKSDFLCSIALSRLPEIREKFSHELFFYHSQNGDYCRGCTLGENIAVGVLTEEETMQKWIASPSHKENLDKPFTHSCTKTYLHYAVQIFGYF